MTDTVRLMLAVVGHQQRRTMLETLAEQLHPEVVEVDTSTDRSEAREWNVHAGAIQAALNSADDATHLVLLQDDARPVPDFRAHAAAAITAQPDAIVSFYLGTDHRHQLQHLVTRATRHADQIGAAWIRSRMLHHGVAVAYPLAVLPELLTWCATRSQPYDNRVGLFARQASIPVMYTWPSLVDHDDSAPVILGRDRPAPRRAHRVGVPASWRADEVHL